MYEWERTCRREVHVGSRRGKGYVHVHVGREGGRVYEGKGTYEGGGEVGAGTSE